jgi:hypothetical protein
MYFFSTCSLTYRVAAVHKRTSMALILSSHQSTIEKTPSARFSPCWKPCLSLAPLVPGQDRPKATKLYIYKKNRDLSDAARASTKPCRIQYRACPGDGTTHTKSSSRLGQLSCTSASSLHSFVLAASVRTCCLRAADS